MAVEMKLCAEASGEAAGEVVVHWRLGKNNLGRLPVMVPAGEDRQAIAEAVAMRHLLGTAQVAGNRLSGKGLSLVVSKGALKKVARLGSTKSHLYDYAYPLTTRFTGAAISVDKDTSWLAETQGVPVAEAIDSASFKGFEVVDTADMGQIGVTRHALEQYCERCGTKDLAAAWANLGRRLRDGGLVEVRLPGHVETHKLRKYGDVPEIWKHPDNPLHFVMERDGTGMTYLVTVFNRAG